MHKLGNSKYILEAGRTEPLPCPKCGDTHTFQVYSNPEVQPAVKCPPLEVSQVCFTACPSCAAAFQVRSEDGATLRPDPEGVLRGVHLDRLPAFRTDG